MSFEGKRVLVTGAARGLGRSITEKFMQEGGTVFALDKDEFALDALKKDHPDVNIITVDLTDWKATQQEIEKILPLHHLVNNAGIIKITSLLTCQEEDVDLVFNVNFKAAVKVGQAFANGVISNGIPDATIVNVSSIDDRYCAPRAFAYSCSKAALTMLTKCMAEELGQHNIRVNCIRPTVMKTDLLNAFKFPGVDVDKEVSAYYAKAAIKRALETSEAADLVLFLSSGKAAMITGEDIAIDGGRHLVE